MLNSPFIIPVVAMLIPIVAIIAGAWNQASAARLKADQRMAMLARGIPPAEIEAILKSTAEVDNGPASKDPMSSLFRVPLARTPRSRGDRLSRASGKGIVDS